MPKVYTINCCECGGVLGISFYPILFYPILNQQFPQPLCWLCALNISELGALLQAESVPTKYQLYELNFPGDVARRWRGNIIQFISKNLKLSTFASTAPAPPGSDV